MIRFKPCFVLARQIVICRKKMPVWAKYGAFFWVYVAMWGHVGKVGTGKQYMEMEKEVE